MMEVTDMVNFRALCAAARNIRIVTATSQSADDPQFTEAWVELMRTAVAWREAAKARALARGGPEQSTAVIFAHTIKERPERGTLSRRVRRPLEVVGEQARMGSSRRPADRRGILGTHASGLHRLDEEQDEAKRHVRQGAPLGDPPLSRDSSYKRVNW